MDFRTDKAKYSVVQFHEKFRKKLPKLAKVHQGFQGGIVEDTFDREQVIRIHTESRQKRVVVHVKQGETKKCFSMPIGYKVKFCVVKKHKSVGNTKEMSLDEIVNKEKLPVNVQFSKKEQVTIGNRLTSTTQFTKMKLVKVFDEIYLLGNFVNKGVFTFPVVSIPLYLSQLLLTEVVGIGGQRLTEYQQYLEGLSDLSRSIMYDPEFGNTDIAEYNPEVIKSDMEYSYIEPNIYFNLADVIKQRPDSYEQLELGASDQSNVYETIELPTSNSFTLLQQIKIRQHEIREHALEQPLKETAKLEHKPDLPVARVNVGNQINSATSFRRPAAAPKPVMKPPGTDDITPPKLPQINSDKRREQMKRSSDISTETANASKMYQVYENNIPRGQVHPTIKSAKTWNENDTTVIASYDTMVAQITGSGVASMGVPTCAKPEQARNSATSFRRMAAAPKPVMKPPGTDDIKPLTLPQKNSDQRRQQTKRSSDISIERANASKMNQVYENYIPQAQIHPTTKSAKTLNGNDTTLIAPHEAMVAQTTGSGVASTGVPTCAKPEQQTKLEHKPDLPVAGRKVGNKINSAASFGRPAAAPKLIKKLPGTEDIKQPNLPQSNSDLRREQMKRSSDIATETANASKMYQVYENNIPRGQVHPTIKSATTLNENDTTLIAPHETMVAQTTGSGVASMGVPTCAKPLQQTKLEHKPDLSVAGRKVGNNTNSLAKAPKPVRKPPTLISPHETMVAQTTRSGVASVGVPTCAKPEQQQHEKAINVSCLRIEEVCAWMMCLKLERHCQTFRDTMIDGSILVELDKDILRNELGLNAIEAVRLLKFAREGHVPK